jgi:hypothetical protein
MALNWQDIAAGLLVLAAVGYLARQAWWAMAIRRGGCGGGCHGCGGQPPGSSEPQVVPLESLTPRQ